MLIIPLGGRTMNHCDFDNISIYKYISVSLWWWVISTTTINKHLSLSLSHWVNLLHNLFPIIVSYTILPSYIFKVYSVMRLEIRNDLFWKLSYWRASWPFTKSYISFTSPKGRKYSFVYLTTECSWGWILALPFISCINHFHFLRLNYIISK